MLLQPVVENAIRHGLEPKVEGGELVVRMRRAGKDARDRDRRHGRGLQPTTRGGVGLANLRDRLEAALRRARVAHDRREPARGRGVTLRLPG